MRCLKSRTGLLRNRGLGTADKMTQTQDNSFPWNWTVSRRSNICKLNRGGTIHFQSFLTCCWQKAPILHQALSVRDCSQQSGAQQSGACLEKESIGLQTSPMTVTCFGTEVGSRNHFEEWFPLKQQVKYINRGFVFFFNLVLFLSQILIEKLVFPVAR